MADFNFPITGTSSFDFGLTGDYTNLNFTEISSGESSYDFEFGQGIFIFELLKGTSNSFYSVWADETASLTNGRFYIGRTNDLTIIKNTNSQVIIEDYYSTTEKGKTNETLSYTDVIDINVTY